MKKLLLLPLAATWLLALAPAPQTAAATTCEPTAESVILTGRITDRYTGEGLFRAAVQVKGSYIGTYTKSDGSYRLSVPVGSAMLECNHPGYSKAERAIADQKVINVPMDVAPDPE
ncbi:carboxypeptidase-like regulatory domain-containing protein [Hymenobacter sp. ASUV-10]|uniref:Carboxypeptidase-like regulatory domain-containing protein n=1 Tax=Hymenobacter aranciens TaxID=3063996 RepID=A0ABT9BBK1_9BACT|nr:carboxypeptidase-like regulatory domain-containing protein [Hymenobacter sp. ASUV-10]MDO7875155.1 carboxypeptidase-like regulatory domain-containing protein [Hymenobacter sp. ASUV-10]